MTSLTNRELINVDGGAILVPSYDSIWKLYRLIRKFVKKLVR